MSKKVRGRRKSTRPSRKSRPPVAERAARAVDQLVKPSAAARLELASSPTLELAESGPLEIVPESDDLGERRPASGTVPVSEPSRADAADGDPPVDPDEVSIPPVGDVEAEQFFSEGDLGKHLAHEPEDEEPMWTAEDERAARRTTPHVVARRERFMRYTKWAVAAGAIVCLAAIGRAAISRAPAAEIDAKNAAFAARAPEPAKAPEPAQAVAPEPVKAAPEPVKAAPEPVQAAPAPEPVKTAAPEKAAAPEAPKAAEPAKLSAGALKAQARALLERGNAGGAIGAGEKAVAADPADGEAWLILGAAYQERGNLAQAQRCYSACVKQGARGPIGECRAMLR